ncbi:mannosyltransferase [Gammaproteobacteria bacterium]
MRNTTPARFATLFLTIGIGLTALAVRLHHLDFESLFMDEWRQISFYPAGWSQITDLAAGMQQPPLDYWIGHWTVMLFGDSDFIVRLPAVVFGTGAVLVLTLLIRQLCALPVALFAGLLAALLPFNVYFSQEARPYAIAHFLYLLLLITFGRHLTTTKNVWGSSGGLFVVAAGFLYTRTLSPLVAIFCLLGLLILQVMWSRWHSRSLRRPMAAILALLLALVTFVPIFSKILTSSTRYTRDQGGGSFFENLTTHLASFEITDLWLAFVVQTEPLTWPLLLLVIATPWLLWRSGLWKKHPLWPYLLALLPLESLLDLIIFSAKTAFPYRPPYAIQLLPLVLAWAAGSVQAMMEMTRNHPQTRLIRLVSLGVGLVMLVQTIASLADFKLSHKKTDWRSAYNYCTNHLGPHQAIIFASLTRPGDWDPVFYIAERYYNGQSPLLNMGDVPAVAEPLRHQPLEPVVLLFQWHEYYLTAASHYPFVPMPGKRGQEFPVVDYSGIPGDARLQVKAFKGMMVIRLREPHGKFSEDAYRLVTTILDHLPTRDGMVNGYFAARALAQVLGKSDEEAIWRTRAEAALAAAQPAR